MKYFFVRYNAEILFLQDWLRNNRERTNGHQQVKLRTEITCQVCFSTTSLLPTCLLAWAQSLPRLLPHTSITSNVRLQPPASQPPPRCQMVEQSSPGLTVPLPCLEIPPDFILLILPDPTPPWSGLPAPLPFSPAGLWSIDDLNSATSRDFNRIASNH